MTIYIDVLFAVNFIINYFLLLTTATIAKTAYRRFRISVASLVGSLYCVMAFTTSFSVLQSIFCKFFITAILALIAFNFASVHSFLRCFFVLLAVGFLFGGFVYGICFLTEPNILYINNLSVYLHISPILLVLFSVFSYLLIVIFNHFLKPKTIDKNNNYRVEISYKNRSVIAEGFVDTGNSLCDIFTNHPVILCSFDTVKAILCAEELDYFSKDISEIAPIFLPKGARIIPLSTVSGPAILPAFRPDFIILENDGVKSKVEEVLVAVFNKDTLTHPSQIILNPELIAEKRQGG